MSSIAASRMRCWRSNVAAGETAMTFGLYRPVQELAEHSRRGYLRRWPFDQSRARAALTTKAVPAIRAGSGTGIRRLPGTGAKPSARPAADGDDPALNTRF